MDRQLIVIIDPMGNPTIEGVNFKGQSCVEKSKEIEAALALGEGVTTREYKPEWHETEVAAHEVEAYN